MTNCLTNETHIEANPLPNAWNIDINTIQNAANINEEDIILKQGLPTKANKYAVSLLSANIDNN